MTINRRRSRSKPRDLWFHPENYLLSRSCNQANTKRIFQISVPTKIRKMSPKWRIWSWILINSWSLICLRYCRDYGNKISDENLEAHIWFHPENQPLSRSKNGTEFGTDHGDISLRADEDLERTSEISELIVKFESSRSLISPRYWTEYG